MADIRFDDRVAVVTGAGGGLGREHALLLASRGARVVVNDLGGAIDGTGASAGPAERTVKEIEDLGGVAVADANTVATVAGGQAIVDTALEAFGRVDIVISNAGILGNFGQSNYGAAKMGLVGLARVLAQEGARHNIKTNVLAPIARTRLTEELLGPLAPKLDPRLVAPVAAWLVSEDCPVSGEIYSAGGGRVARFFVGLTEGYANPALTLEDVRDHVGQIRDETGYSVPAGVAEEIASLVERLR